ncbi:hypothetical protein HRbin24_00096 [bacterium HR24]|nr:hypothetical protein HRbin24_00096 [bacterium HR24]
MLREYLLLEKFREWLQELGDQPCGRYEDPVGNTLCRFLREATPLKGATLYPGDTFSLSLEPTYLLAVYIPGEDWVQVEPVDELPEWVGLILQLEEELHDEAEEAGASEVPASVLLERLAARLSQP